TSGDYLSGFLLGTREALHEKGRQSVTLTLREVTPFAVGVLIALFERAVGLYASLVHINAYHQPGVEAGKKAASAVLALQARVLACLAARQGQALTAAEIAAAAQAPGEEERIFKICEHLAANPARGVTRSGGPRAASIHYRLG
ncbi:MAG: Glucose-6-phosphate isomerase, partial [Verrucomicrobiota bacterium]